MGRPPLGALWGSPAPGRGRRGRAAGPVVRTPGLVPFGAQRPILTVLCRVGVTARSTRQDVSAVVYRFKIVDGRELPATMREIPEYPPLSPAQRERLTILIQSHPFVRAQRNT